MSLTREYDTQVDLAPVALDSVVRTCWSNVDTGPARIEVRTDRTVRADETRLKRPLENLLRNAVEHGSTSPRSDGREDAVEHGSTGGQASADDAVEHGSGADRTDADGVVITTEALDGGFYVEDDGPGIGPEESESVFQYGYSTTPDGTGLGLAIAAQCADVHGWAISVTAGTDGGARSEITGVDVGAAGVDAADG